MTDAAADRPRIAPSTRPLQPLLHDSVVLLGAPSQAWSGPGGDMGGERGIHGFYHSDVRVLDELTLRVGGERPEHISHSLSDPGCGTFVSLARNLDDRGADPQVRVDRIRRIRGGMLEEEVTLSNALDAELDTAVAVRIAADFSSMHAIKAGTSDADHDGLRSRAGGAGAVFDSGTVTATFHAAGATVTVGGRIASASWPLVVPAHGSATIRWSIQADDLAAVVRSATTPPEWADLQVHSGDSRISSWVHTAVRDLTALRMATRDAPEEAFLAAGAPWFFTLFGRDAIWSARFLLPLGTKLAASTLRVLATLQGTRDEAASAEQPGKIMHELRPKTLTIPGEGVELPPLYYGSVDATPLWIILLHDAWRWGMPEAEVRALLPNLEAALAWMRDDGDSDGDGDGFLEYVDTTGHGLANQGWKDSGDSIQWRDGHLAEGPIALCEVQGYAYEAAMGGAELLDRFGLDGADTWREWAAALKRRFAEVFWVASVDGDYPAVALDAAKRPVDSVTSNIGHLLGTGIMDETGSALVAARLTSPELSSGFGVRTMSTDAAGYWPLSYHGGSVWTHDTAIAISGLRRAGFAAEAAGLIDGLLAAADGFEYRMPELYSGDSATGTGTPVPYPAACRPQAWSAAAAIAVLGAALGLEPGADGVRTDPLPALGPIEVDGLRFAGRPFRASA